MRLVTQSVNKRVFFTSHSKLSALKAVKAKRFTTVPIISYPRVLSYYWSLRFIDTTLSWGDLIFGLSDVLFGGGGISERRHLIILLAIFTTHIEGYE